MGIFDHLNMWIRRKIAETFTVSSTNDTSFRVKGETALISKNGNEALINESGQLLVVLDGKVDDNNTTQEVLAGDATFLGDSTITLDYALIIITVFSDVASATDGLCVQISTDNIIWRDGDRFTISANISKTFSFQTNTKYYRIRYTNGSTLQGTFDLQAILKKTNSKASSHRINDNISQEDDAELVKSVLTAQKPNGVFSNIKATPSGNLQVANVESGLNIAKGEVSGTTFVHKFGQAPDFDQADGIITVWDGADDSDIALMRYVYSSTADIDSVSSSSALDTFLLYVEGLDINYEFQSEFVQLTGQTRKALANNYLRVFRMYNANSTDNDGRIYCFVNVATTGGVPNITANIRAVIQPGNNQTLMAVYTIPAGKTGYMRDWYASTAGASKSSQYPIELRSRPFGSVFRLKHTSAIGDTGTSYIKHEYIEPEIFTEKTDIEMRVSSTALGATGVIIAAGFDLVLIDN